MISVAIPAYKSKYLKQAINSVLLQSYGNFELIIINDNSPDNIDEVVNNFKDTRIRYYRNQVNLGGKNIVKSWNKCLEYAKGDYFVLFSDDDIYEPSFLDKLNTLSLKYPEVELFHARAAQIDLNDNVTYCSPSLPEHEDIIDFISSRFFFNRIQFVPDFMVKTDALRRFGGFFEIPLAWGADDITWINIAKEKGIVHCNEILYKWRFSGINISAIGNVNERLFAINKYEQWFIKFINTLNDNDKGDIRFKYLQHNYHKWFINQRKYLLNVYKAKNGIFKTLFKFLNNKQFKQPLLKTLYYCIKPNN